MKIYLRLLSVILGLLLAAPCLAARVPLEGTETELPLAPLTEIFEDRGASLDVPEAVRQTFVPASSHLLNPGFTNSALWLRYSFSNASATPLSRWLTLNSPRLQEVSLFIPNGDQWRRMDAGTRAPFAKHPLRTTVAAFPLEIPPGATLTVYLRVASETTITIEPTLWEPLTFVAHDSNQGFGNALLLGALALNCLFSLLMFIGLRDRAFLIYGAGVLCYVIFEFNAKGYGFMYLWPTATDWATRAIGIFGLLSSALMVPFVQNLLLTRERLPRLDKIMTFSALPAPLLVLGMLLGRYHFWTTIASVQSLVIMMTLGVSGCVAIWKRFPASRFYSAAFVIALVDNVLRMSEIFGLGRFDILGIDYHAIVLLFAQIMLLSAVVDRIMQARVEKEAALKALNETLEAQEAHLEKAVADRTADLDTALNKVRSAHQAQSQLLGYIGHDLRTPLATIVNYVHQLNQGNASDVPKYQEAIERSATFQLELIDELLEYSRGELQRLELHPVPTYLYSWLDDIAIQGDLLARQHNNHFFLEAPPTLPPVVVFDPRRLRQVLHNLLGNAAKFTSDGTIKLHLGESRQTAGAITLVWTVEDTGPGISPADQERIFMPFERSSSALPGAGLGLSIARQIVRSMDGELKLESVPGAGSRFSFEIALPVAKESDVHQAVEAFALPEPFGQGKRALIACDQSAGDNISDVLSMADFDVVVAQDGGKALPIAAQDDVDVVIADTSTPGLDLKALLEFMSSRKADGPRLILCSGAPISFTGLPEMKSAAVLLKPVTANKLIRTLENLFSSDHAKPADGFPHDKELEQLRALAALGNLSDIELWAEAFAARSPERADFAMKIRQAARDIDMDQLERLTGTR